MVGVDVLVGVVVVVGRRVNVRVNVMVGRGVRVMVTVLVLVCVWLGADVTVIWGVAVVVIVDVMDMFVT